MRAHKCTPGNPGKVRQMPCSERARLLRVYAGASARLSDTVAELARSALSAKLGFEGAWYACEEARSRCDQIQHLIYKHVQDHHCALEIAEGPLPKNGPATSRDSGFPPSTDGRSA